MTQTPNQKRQRGRPSRISREAIARAALDMGVGQATIPAIAAHLKVDHSSLYHYVKGRNEVVTMAADLAINELDWRAPEATNWRDELIILTDAIWVLYDRNPGLAEAIRQANITPSSGILSFAESVKKLQQKGFSLKDAVVAVDVLVDMVGECFLGWWSTDKAEEDGRTRKERIIAIWQAEARNVPEKAEQINAMIDIMQGGRRSWWESKRDLVLEGIMVTQAQNSKMLGKAQT
ncbi:MAG: TetR/AcrR family transcriptional regulator [Paraglaciecola sp.]|uniref:TetR/AcrR family transcriptional regulator n=1 Tax=Paraglaciecola sp. TaxID=1920173 RepID=UPI0032991B29